MAVVYFAKDLRHFRDVAIKIFRREGNEPDEGSERFLQEIKIAARLSHPNILPLHDSGDDHGLLYYVMPYVPGESLRQRLEREGALPLADALKKNTRLLNRSGAEWTPYLAYSNGCSLGDDAGCEAMKKETARPPSETRAASAAQVGPLDAPAKEGPSDVEGANLHMTGMNVDGIALDDVACKLQDPNVGGILGGIVLGAGFKSKKAALDGCSKGVTTRTRVRWTGQGGRMTNIKAAGKDAATNRCVERALTVGVQRSKNCCKLPRARWLGLAKRLRGAK